MEETRVQRYKEYRNSFIKEGSIAPNAELDSETIDVRSTTSTLPISEVIDAVKEEEQKDVLLKESKKKHLVSIIIRIAIAVVLLLGLAVLGYFAWR